MCVVLIVYGSRHNGAMDESKGQDTGARVANFGSTESLGDREGLSCMSHLDFDQPRVSLIPVFMGLASVLPALWWGWEGMSEDRNHHKIGP